MSDMKWYVVHTYSGMEKSAESALRERIAREGLQDCFEEILVPTEDISEVKNGKSVFPPAVCTRLHLRQMIMNDETWHLVKNTARITGFLGGSANKPSPLPAKDIEAIKSKMEAGSEAPRPRVEFEVGGSVRIKNGPFTDFNGIIEEVNYDKNRLRVMVSIFGRDTPVELAFNEVEKA
ncbi:MAG: transcription termination/antitermination protein NusG [Parasutterella excrementihominis]